MIGTSGAAPQKVIPKGLNWVGFPEFDYWSPARAGGAVDSAREYEFGDGGILENLGVMPMLVRRVERLIVFVNTKNPLNGPDSINDSIPPLFGRKFPLNQVFPSDQYLPLVSALRAKKQQGTTVFHQATYRVQDNEHYGIEGGWDVDVLWVYNEQVPAWENQLPTPVSDLIDRRSGKAFPHYETFGQNFPKIIDLTAEQASLLAHLSCWNVFENRSVFLNFV